MTALFIGRFQPFHIGHASVLHFLYQADVEHVIIGVGSAQYSRTEENPFTFEERKQMIEAALADAKTPSFEIIAIDDIHNPPEWVTHVNNTVQKNYDVVYSGNPLVQKLFQDAGQQTREVNFSINIDGSTIRHMIATGDSTWREFVHPDVAKQIQQHDFTAEA
jgi:nicotinamide-nucleotide adenylyltransferase